MFAPNLLQVMRNGILMLLYKHCLHYNPEHDQHYIKLYLVGKGHPLNLLADGEICFFSVDF